MSKRFTATEKWDKPWYRKLPARLKCLWQFLCDRCDQAGVLEIDWDLASFQIGEDVAAGDLAAFGERVKVLKDGRIWLTAFVEFQYGKLSGSCPAHKPVLRTLIKHFPDTNGIGYQYPINTLQEEEEEKEEEGEVVKDKEGEPEKKRIAPKPPAPIFPSDLPEEYRQIFTVWWSYKRERGESYKPMGWDALIKLHRTKSIQALTRDVESSMAANYAGIFAPKDGLNAQKPRHAAYSAESATAGYTAEEVLNFMPERP